MASTKQGLVAHCNGGKVRKFADGGKPQETADELIARISKTYGASGNAQPQPAPQQPAQQPAQQPQPQLATGQGIVGLMKNRGNQIDRMVSSYSDGGKVRSFDLGGTIFKDDSIGGLKTRLATMQASNGGASSVTAQFNTADQNAQMNKIAGVPAPGSVVAPVAPAVPSAATQPVAPQEQSGLVAYANGGKIKGPGTPTSDSIPAVVEETGEPIRVANKERILSKAQDDFISGIAKKAGFDSLDAFLEAGTGKPVGPTMKGGKPAAANGMSIADDFTNALKGDTGLASLAKVFGPAQKAMPDIPPEDAAAYAKQTQPTGLAASAMPQLSPSAFGGNSVDTAFKAPAASGVASMASPSPDTQFLTGKAGAAPDSSGGGFFKDNSAYTVKDTKQDGVSKVTAKGASPLYTNIKPEDGVAGLSNQTVGDPKEGLARFAQANAITQSIIDKQPQGGIGILNDPNDAANAEKTARWRTDDLIAKSRSNPAAAQAIAGTLHNQGQAEAGQLAQQTAASGLVAAALRDDKRNALESRGQDMHLKGEEMRISGNPLDNKAKQATLDQQKQTSDLQAKYLAATDPKEKSALAEQIRGISGKGIDDDVVVVPGGEYTDPENPLVKMKQPSMIYNRRTGQYSAPPAQTGGAGPAAAPSAAIEMLKKNPDMASAFDAKYGQGASKKHLGN